LEQASFEQKRQLVELLIDRVIVTNEEVEIRYVIPTSSASERVRFCHLRLDYFHYPPAGGVLLLALLIPFLLADAPNVGLIPRGRGRRFARRVVIAFVQA
jgi:hypothetical protein